MKRLERQGFAAGGECSLTLSTRPVQGVEARRASDAAFLKAAAALWLLTRLGGVGARTRRGGGSIQVTRVSEDWPGKPADFPRWETDAASPVELRGELSTGLASLCRLVTGGRNVRQAPTGYDALHPEVCYIGVLPEPFRDWNSALGHFGEAMRSFREGCTGFPSAERAAFGLPLPFYFRRDNRTVTITTTRREEYGRRASPLLVRVTRLRSNDYAVVVTLFKAEFLPRGIRLVADDGTHLQDIPADVALVGEFLSGLNLLEVSL